MATKYLVWKDPACQGKNIEWVELTGKEFYQLTAQPENKGRRFIKLDDSVCEDADVIIIEATLEQYRNWLPERDSHKYLMETKSGTQALSLDQPVNGRSDILLADVIPDDCGMEEVILKRLLITHLSKLMRCLSISEQELVDVLFLHNPENLSEREIARRQDIPQKTLNCRKIALLKKSKKFSLKIGFCSE